MATECKSAELLFPELIKKKVTVDFKAGFVSSDGGAVLLGRLDRSTGLLKRFSDCFTDHRDPELIEHTLESLIRQRVFGLALGYEDLRFAWPVFTPTCGSDSFRSPRLPAI